MKDVLFGLIGGALGALLWAVVTYLSGYEIGWIAWAVGGLVGFAVALGNREGHRAPMAAGSLAAIITVLSLVAGKALAIQMLLPSDAEIMEMFAVNFDEEEYVISYLADDIVVEYQAQGRTLEWPEGVDPAGAAAQGDYPDEIWAEAQQRWTELGEEGQAEFRLERQAQVRANIEENLPQIREAMSSGGFFASFAPMDLIFFGLAIVTAFGMGSGHKGDDEEEETVEEEGAEDPEAA